MQVQLWATVVLWTASIVLLPKLSWAAALTTDTHVALRAANGHYLNALNGGGGPVRVDQMSAIDSTVFTFIDATHPNAPYNGDVIYLQAKDGHYLSVACGGGATWGCGGVTAAAPAAGTQQSFHIYKVSGSPGLAIADGDVAYLASVRGYECGPSQYGAGVLFTCVANWPHSSQFFTLEVQSAAASRAPTPPAALNANDLQLNVPAAQTVGLAAALNIAGVSLVDPWAQNHAGTMALNVTANHGSVIMKGVNYGNAAHLSGTFVQINDNLGSLVYQAGPYAITDTLTVDVWNQAGVEATRPIPITVQPISTPSPAPAPIPTPAPTPSPSSGPTGAGPSAGNIPSDTTGVLAFRAQQLLNGFGVVTHIDFPGYKTIGLAGIEKAINYLGGVKILRDYPGDDTDLTTWPEVARATGVKFLAAIGEGSPAVYADQLDRMKRMAHAPGAYIYGFEGGNEEDDDWPVSQGNSLQQAAAFQQQVWQAGQQLHLPVFQISFGAGWDKPTGDYGTVGDLSVWANYGNAHTYPQASPNFNANLLSLHNDALLATPGKPVAHTEYGWNTFPDGSAMAGWGWCTEKVCAAYALEFMFDAFKLGDPYYFYYELFDDRALENANSWGLFFDNGTPKAAATAIHNLFQLLGDSGGNALNFSPGKLNYTVNGLPAGQGGMGGQQALFQQSDGSFWLVLWNEQDLNDLKHNNVDISFPDVHVTLELATAATVNVYDPLTATAPVSTFNNAVSVPISLPTHPVLVKIVRP